MITDLLQITNKERLLNTPLTITKVESLWFPLVKKFYQAHYPNGKPNKSDPMWAIKQGATIIAVARLRQFDDVQLLTGVVTHPDYRQQGFATQLLQSMSPELAMKPCYCFNHQALCVLYRAIGFEPTVSQSLPAELRSRYERYRLKQPHLIAMHFKPQHIAHMEHNLKNT